MRRPKVSIIVPVYNARLYLRETMESVLAQRGVDIEVVVADDGSTDGSLESISDLLEDRRVRLHRQANAGKATAINRVLPTCDADFYAVQDADDLADPMRAATQAAALDAAPHLAGVFCGYDNLIAGRRLAPIPSAKDERACARDIELFRMPGHDPTAMYRLSMVREFQFSPDLAVGQGIDYILRIGERFPFRCIPDVLYGYRIHDFSNTKSDPERRQRFVREVILRACRRRGIDPDLVPLASLSVRPKSAMRRDNNLFAHFCLSASELRRSGRWFEAFGVACESVRMSPFDRAHYKPLLHALLPMGVLDRRRARRDAALAAAIARARLGTPPEGAG